MKQHYSYFSKKCIYLYIFLCLAGDIYGQTQENSKTENSQLIEWSKKCIQEFFYTTSESDTILYEPQEWILIVQNALYSLDLKMEEKQETLRGCIRLLDNRGEFDQYQEISEDPDAFIAVSLDYAITSKRTGIKLRQYETTFILDNKGKVIELYDYIRPIAIRQMTTKQTLDIMKDQVCDALGQDTTNSEWIFRSDIQNWVLQKENKILIQMTPLELIYFNQKYMKKPQNKSLIKTNKYYQ